MTEPQFTVECTQAPEGWRCTRGWPHDGPCAAVPSQPLVEAIAEAIARAVEPNLDALRSDRLRQTLIAQQRPAADAVLAVLGKRGLSMPGEMIQAEVAAQPESLSYHQPVIAIDVQGTTYYDINRKAKNLAFDFFGESVPREQMFVEPFSASPVRWTSDGTACMWEAEVVVRVRKES